MADTTHEDVAFIMKRRYSDKDSTEVATREHPSFYEIAKEQAFDGEDFRYPVQTGNPQSIGSGAAGFAIAQSAAGPNAGIKGEQFAAEPMLKYGVLKLDGPSMQRARGNKGSFFNFVTRHADGLLEELGANLAYDLHRDGNGIRGRRLSIVGNVVTLYEKRDVDHFRRGMVVGASANADGSAPKVGTTFVTKLDRANKQITLDNAAAIAAFADGDYLFRSGDPGQCMDGFAKCTPLAAPAAGDSFRGVNRSVDVEALAGSRIDNAALYPEEVLGDLAVEVHILNKRLRRGVMYPTKFQDVVKRLGAKVEYHNPGGSADIGFESFIIHAAGAPMRVYSDPDCPVDRTRGFDPKAHVYKHIDEVVHWIRTSEGGQSQWSTSTDGIEMRARSHGNYIQYDTAPHAVGSVQ